MGSKRDVSYYIGLDFPFSGLVLVQVAPKTHVLYGWCRVPVLLPRLRTR